VIADRAQGEPCANHAAPRWRVLLDRANASPRCGAAGKRTGQPCQGAAMPNGRCRMHGGTSRYYSPARSCSLLSHSFFAR